MSKPLIAIDGPAGVGKSSTARQVAWRLGLPYLDTGALYRAAAWAVIKAGVEVSQSTAVEKAVDKAEISFAQTSGGIRVWVDGVDVTTDIRSPVVNRVVSPVCEIPGVRGKLVALQRRWAARGFGVMEGRDIGTVVLPKAGLKIFMTARPEIRAIRRGRELGIEHDSEALTALTKELAERDKRDAERPHSPLAKASDALLIDNSEMTFEDQVDCILRLASERFGSRLYASSLRP
ncbi:MAG: (d)CMP kinase [Calditrichaeota bacterium]|nr:(d)CMP kinase [Calditrichota bacterium]